MYKIGLGGASMVAEQTCMGPLLCRDQLGNCCELFLFKGRVVCPVSCSDDINRQSQQQSGYTLRQVFDVTLVTTFMYNVLTNIGSTTTTTTIPTTATTIPITTTTPTPIFTTSM